MPVFPALSPAVIHFIRAAYGALLLATLASVLPHARRYFLSERWGGYAQRGPWVDPVQNPIVMPALFAMWIVAAFALVAGRLVVAAALVNFLLCRYFFIQMRWHGVLRGMGAPGFISYWLAAAVLLLELTSRYAPAVQGLAILVLQVDFALIMLSAGAYKFSAGYPQGQGMDLGMANPEWGYWWRFWHSVPPSSAVFRFLNQMAWSTEVVAGLLMLYPPTRVAGGMLILLSFVFIATQIRLGFLCEMVIVCCFVFATPGSFVDRWIAAYLPADAPPVSPMPALATALSLVLWAYLALLPIVRAGLEYNFRARKGLPPPVQRLLEIYTNMFGMIIWRVFSADTTNFFVQIYAQLDDGSRQLVSRWGRSLRFLQVAESITVTTLFTTLRYYPSNNALFVDRVVRYARTIAAAPGRALVFEYVRLVKRSDGFDFVPAAELLVDRAAGTVQEHVLDATLPLRAPAEGSPIHEGVRPGSYVPLVR